MNTLICIESYLFYFYWHNLFCLFILFFILPAQNWYARCPWVLLFYSSHISIIFIHNSPGTTDFSMYTYCYFLSLKIFFICSWSYSKSWNNLRGLFGSMQIQIFTFLVWVCFLLFFRWSFYLWIEHWRTSDRSWLG